jgi:hypothetical protein
MLGLPEYIKLRTYVRTYVRQCIHHVNIGVYYPTHDRAVSSENNGGAVASPANWLETGCHPPTTFLVPLHLTIATNQGFTVTHSRQPQIVQQGPLVVSARCLWVLGTYHIQDRVCLSFRPTKCEYRPANHSWRMVPSRVVHGLNHHPGRHPWLVYLDGSYHCSSPSIITANWESATKHTDRISSTKKIKFLHTYLWFCCVQVFSSLF